MLGTLTNGTPSRGVPVRPLLLALAAALALALPGAALAQDARPGEGTRVRPAVANWQSALPVEAIVAELMKELGYDVQPARTLGNPLFYQAVAQGDVDYWANSWFPLQNSFLTPRVRENVEVVGTIMEKGAIQGYLVDKASAERFNITSLADLKRPEVREAFDVDGDGKIPLLGCTEGWACLNVMKHHMETYGLEDTIELITSAYSPAFADVLARYRAGEPVVFYTWTPNFTTLELVPGEDVVWINVPEVVPYETQVDIVESLTATGIEGAVTDPLKLGFGANDVQVTANKGFLADNPAARALFEQVQISVEDVTEMTVRVARGEGSSSEVAAIAREWIAQNRAAVDGWLEAARQAAQ